MDRLGRYCGGGHKPQNLHIDNSDTEVAELLREFDILRYEDCIGRETLHVTEARRLLSSFSIAVAKGDQPTAKKIRDGIILFGFDDWKCKLDNVERRMKASSASFSTGTPVSRESQSAMARHVDPAPPSPGDLDRLIVLFLAKNNIEPTFKLLDRPRESLDERSEMRALVSRYAQARRRGDDLVTESIRRDLAQMGFHSILLRLDDKDAQMRGEGFFEARRDNELGRMLNDLGIKRYSSRLGSLSLGHHEVRFVLRLINQSRSNNRNADVSEMEQCARRFAHSCYMDQLESALKGLWSEYN